MLLKVIYLWLRMKAFSILLHSNNIGIISEIVLEKAFFGQKWLKIEKKSRFFYFNHFCWQNWEYIQCNRSQNKKEVYFLISSKFDPIFKICQGCKIFRIFLNSPFPWWKMVLHTKFRAYGTKIELPTSQNVVWPTIMAQTLYSIESVRSS